MRIDMKRDGHENIAFFIGPEVEHTPAYSKKTLFVVGKQDLDTILNLAREHKVSHVFMGANHSFDVDPTDTTFYWDKTITALLDRGYWVTLDYPAHQHAAVLNMLNKGVWQSRTFVPMLGVRIPKVQTSSLNLIVKIDDIDFKATNPGVWCMHFHEVTDSNRFTDWQEYGSDVVIHAEDDKPTPMPPYIPQPQVSTEMRGMRKPIDLKDLVSTVYADINKPDIDLESIRETLAEDEKVKNDQELGLDPKAKSALKGKPDVKVADVADIDVLEAYAAGTTSDPLSAEGSKKGTKKK